MDRPQDNRKNKIFQRFQSQRKLKLEQKPVQPRNVKFSQKLTNDQDIQKRHKSASILKKRQKYSLQKNPNQRSDSLNSMASQGPLDDQSCQNSNLNKAIKQEYYSSFQAAKKKGKFRDDIFPPVMSSIFSYAARKINKHPNVKWKRITDVFAGRELVVTHPSGSKVLIRPSTNLSSQYFCLALNTLRGNKLYLKKMFEDQKINSQGIYFAKIFQGNVWKYIIVDDFIPVLDQGESKQKQKVNPVFLTCECPPHQPLQIWPFILQKALAKYYSSYQSLQTGNIFDLLQELTNKTCDQYDVQNSKQQFQTALSNQDVIGFGQTVESVKIPLQFGVGNSRKISFIFKNKQKLIIDSNQLSKYFTKIYLLGVKNYSYIGQCPVRQSKQSISVRHFSLKKPGFCCLTLNQKDRKFFQQPIKYSYIWMRMILIQKQYNGSYRWIDGRYDNQKTLSIETQLQLGQYYVLILPQWLQKSFALTLIIRTKLPVRLQRKSYQQGIIQQACADLAQRYGRLNQLNTYICSYNCIHQDIGFIIQNINNQRTKGHVKIVRSIDGLKSKVLIQPINKEFEKNKSIEVTIRHNTHFTIVLKMKGGIDRQFFKQFDFGIQ